MLPRVVQKERVREPHTGEDKGAGARQAFGGAGFAVTGVEEAREEQLKGLAALGIQVPFPRVRVNRQLLGGEQPTARQGRGGHEVDPAKRRVAQ
jgi:hypothetical protein